MKRKLVFMILLIIILISTGCQRNTVRDSDEMSLEEKGETEKISINDNNNIIEEKDTELEKEIIKNFYAMIRDKKSIEELMEYTDENIDKVKDVEKQNEMIETLYKAYNDEIKSEIFKTTDMKYPEWFKIASRYKGILNFNIEDDIEKIDNDDIEFKKMIQECYNKGYKFRWGYGGLRIESDYKLFLQKYEKYMSHPLKVLLTFYIEETYNPIIKINENFNESMKMKDAFVFTVTYDKLIERMLQLEKLLDNYPNFEYGWEIRIYYSMSLNTFFDLIAIKIEEEDKLIDFYKGYEKKYPDTNIAPYIDEYLEILRKNNYDIESIDARKQIDRIQREIRNKYN